MDRRSTATVKLLFSIEICAFAILSNHIHLVLKAIPDESNHWTDKEVVRRWLSIFRRPLIAYQYLSGGETSKAEKDMLSSLISHWRQRLTDISWFMKCLNEPIARHANKEDHCTGHFWDRFLLLDNCSCFILPTGFLP